MSFPNGLSTFPSTNSIPPACFFDRQGLSNWLNNNPTYKQFYINRPNNFPYLYAMTSSLSSLNYNIENVPLAPFVTTLSQSQSMLYTQQIELFKKVYAFNSNAYINSVATDTAPVYYSFKTYQEMMQFKSSVSLINKMYPFDAMANATNETGVKMQWVVPFPL